MISESFTPALPEPAMLSDAALIIGLMRTETDALGFIPGPAIRNRFVPRGHYRMIRGRGGKRIGYFLLSPLRRGKLLQIHQACVDYDFRRRRYAAAALASLIAEALENHVPEIQLRCALDLEANAFWLTMGFELLHLTQGGARRHRLRAPACNQGRLQPHTMQIFDTGTIPDVEALGLQPLAVNHDAPVGQHTVHIHYHPADSVK